MPSLLLSVFVTVGVVSFFTDFFLFIVPVFSDCSYTVPVSELEVVEDCGRRAIVCVAATGGAGEGGALVTTLEEGEAPTKAGAVAVARAVWAAAVTTAAVALGVEMGVDVVVGSYFCRGLARSVWTVLSNAPWFLALPNVARGTLGVLCSP